MKRFLYTLCQCTWGLPQTLLGLILFLPHRAKRQENFHGAVVTCWHARGCASLGLFLFMEEGAASHCRLLRHEYGHTLQSLLLGPLYLPLIALPSVLWFHLPLCRRLRQEKGIAYGWFYTERWADLLGEKFCG